MSFFNDRLCEEINEIQRFSFRKTSIGLASFANKIFKFVIFSLNKKKKKIVYFIREFSLDYCYLFLQLDKYTLFFVILFYVTIFSIYLLLTIKRLLSSIK